MLNPYARQYSKPDPGRDRRTMIVLIAATIVLGGIFLYALNLAGRKPVDESSPYTEENDWGGDLVERLGYEDVTLPDNLSASIGDDTEAGRLRVRGPAYDYLLGEVADRPFRFFNRRGYTRIPGDLPTSELLENPGLHRAEPVTAKGTLLHLEEKPLQLPAPQEVVWAGTMRIEGDTVDGGPAYAYFESVDEPEGLLVGQVVQIYGLFFKKFEFPVEDTSGVKFRTGPFFIARKAKRSYIYLDVREIDPTVLRRVKDETPVEMTKIDDVAWYHLASYAANLDPDQFRAQIFEDTDMRQVYRLPGAFRGKPVKFRGKLIEMWKVPLEDNPTGLEAYYDGIVHTLDSVTTRIRFVRKPTGVQRGDYVSVRGLFLQNYKYEAQAAETWPQVPLVVGVSIDRIRFEDRTLSHLSVILAGVAGTLFLVLAVSVVLGWRRDRAFEEDYRERRRKRLERRRGASPAAAVASAGGAPDRDSQESPRREGDDG